MNIQIFYKSKCFDSKKAERWFKERGIKAQMIDLNQKGMSRGEFMNVLRAVGSLDLLIDDKSKAEDMNLSRAEQRISFYFSKIGLQIIEKNCLFVPTPKS